MSTPLFVGSYLQVKWWAEKEETFATNENICSLLKQNTKSCNTKRRRQRRRTVKKNNRSNLRKSNFARAADIFCTFLCQCFARLQRETSRNFLVTSFMEEMSYVFSFTFFFTAAHFHLALVAASISHFVTAATKFSCCSSNKKNVSFVFYLSL